MTVISYFPFRLTLQAPVVVTGSLHDPSTVTTLRHIPASSIRGALAQKLGDPQSDPAKLAEFRSLVLGGNVLWLDAYPVIGNERSLPASVAMRRNRDDSEERSMKFVDLTRFDGRPDDSHEVDDHWPEESLAGLGECFVTFGGTRYRHTPRVSGRVHQQRDREKGRSWTETNRYSGVEIRHGALFAVESLDAGQVFEGSIQIRAATELERDQILARIKQLLGDTVLIGRSRRAEYGGNASIEFQPARPREWQQLNTLISTDLKAGDEFHAMTVSTCLIRDSLTGQMDPESLKQTINDRFGGRALVQFARWSFETAGGFNRKWRLEVPQSLGVATGSVLVLKANANIPVGDLIEIENAGFGERKAEGFGRIVFVRPRSRRGRLDSIGSHLASGPPQTSPPQLITTLQLRLVTIEAERQIELIAGGLMNGNARPPSNSLLGRLREPLRNQANDGSCGSALKTLREWLDDRPENPNRLKRPAMDQLRKGCVRENDCDCSLGSWLKRVVNANDLTSIVNLQVMAQRVRLISVDPATNSDPVLDILDAMKDRLKVRLIDAVLAGLALKNRSQGTLQ